MRFGLLLSVALLVAGCIEVPMETTAPPKQRPAVAKTKTTAQVSPRSFAAVVRQVEPVAERICRNRTPGANCDFQIVVDTRADQPPNAYQTVDKAGRPVIAFNVALIAEAQNVDELAFVMGHEAAHHISGHLGRTRNSAVTGAALGGILAAVVGADAGTADTFQNLGGTLGARTFSKDYELEADALGTIIAYRAGYDPEVGARFFTRIPDPGNRFLGTHPPNKSRIKAVRQTMASLR